MGTGGAAKSATNSSNQENALLSQMQASLLAQQGQTNGQVAQDEANTGSQLSSQLTSQDNQAQQAFGSINSAAQTMLGQPDTSAGLAAALQGAIGPNVADQFAQALGNTPGQQAAASQLGLMDFIKTSAKGLLTGATTGSLSLLGN